MCFAPNQEIVKIQPYMVSCITGEFIIISFSAAMAKSLTLADCNKNLSVSCFSLTYAFTTRIPAKFSCTVPFILSTSLNILWNLENEFTTIYPKIPPKKIKATKKIQDTCGASFKHINKEKININGARTQIRIII